MSAQTRTQWRRVVHCIVARLPEGCIQVMALKTERKAVLSAPKSGHALAAVAQLGTGNAGYLCWERSVLVYTSRHGCLDFVADQQLLDGEPSNHVPAPTASVVAVCGLASVQSLAARQ